MAKEYIERERVVMGILGLTIVDPMVAQYADAVLYQIHQAPTADVVEVVRCKDCFYNANGCCTKSEWYDDTRYRPDYFCADGYRRDDNAAD